MKKITLRDIKKEEEITNKVIEKAKILYVKERLNNIGHGYTDFLAVFGSIKKHIYSFHDEDGVMGEFNKYLDGFDNDEEGDKKVRAAIDRFIKEFDTKLNEFELKISNEISKRNITTIRGLMKYGKEMLDELEK